MVVVVVVVVVVAVVVPLKFDKSSQQKKGATLRHTASCCRCRCRRCRHRRRCLLFRWTLRRGAITGNNTSSYTVTQSDGLLFSPWVDAQRFSRCIPSRFSALASSGVVPLFRRVFVSVSGASFLAWARAERQPSRSSQSTGRSWRRWFRKTLNRGVKNISECTERAATNLQPLPRTATLSVLGSTPGFSHGYRIPNRGAMHAVASLLYVSSEARQTLDRVKSHLRNHVIRVGTMPPLSTMIHNKIACTLSQHFVILVSDLPALDTHLLLFLFTSPHRSSSRHGRCRRAQPPRTRDLFRQRSLGPTPAENFPASCLSLATAPRAVVVVGAS